MYLLEFGGPENFGPLSSACFQYKNLPFSLSRYGTSYIKVGKTDETAIDGNDKVNGGIEEREQVEKKSRGWIINPIDH